MSGRNIHRNNNLDKTIVALALLVILSWSIVLMLAIKVLNNLWISASNSTTSILETGDSKEVNNSSEIKNILAMPYLAPRGIMNVNNSCFFGTAMQILASIKDVVSYLLKSNPDKEKQPVTYGLRCAMNQLILLKLSNNSKTT